MAVPTHVLKYSLLNDIVVPIVTGGTLTPQAPIGAKRAAALIEPTDDTALLEPQSLVRMARIRVARLIAPIDLVGDITPAEWCLAAAFNDLLQATHPDYRGVFRKKGPTKLLTAVDAMIDLVPPCASIGEGLARHTLFARMFEAARIDVRLKWWTGSATFLGTEAPKRLSLWPELRHVRETKTRVPLMDLANPDTSRVDRDAFALTVRKFLTRTPLTDLATADRTSPPFGWTEATVGFVATVNGRTLALRSMVRRTTEQLDAALGVATSVFFDEGGVSRVPMPAMNAVVTLLGERELARAWEVVENGRVASAATPAAQAARSLGARRIADWLAANPTAVGTRVRERLLEALAVDAKRPLPSAKTA